MSDWLPSIASRRGAIAMDRIMPEWFTTINASKLDMCDPRWCILGQLYYDQSRTDNGYVIAFQQLFRALGKDTNRTLTMLSEYGMSAPSHFYYETLTAMWLEEIKKRRIKFWNENYGEVLTNV